MNIVGFQSKHHSGVDNLWKACFPSDPRRNSASYAIPAKLSLGQELGGDLFLIAENSSGDVIGSIIAGYDGHRGWLYAVAVAPEHRHQGIGSALVETACERLRVLGCNKVNLQIRSENASIGKFYRKLGFEEEPRISMGREI